MKTAPPIVSKIYKSVVERQQADIKIWMRAMEYAEQVQYERRAPLVSLYKNALLDTHLSGIIEKRKATILNTNIGFGSEGKENSTLTDLINSPEGLNLQSDIMDTLFFGHSLLECSFSGDTFTYSLIPRSNVLPQSGRIILDLADYDNYINFRDPTYSDTLLEIHALQPLGLLSKAVPMVIYKRNCLGDFAQYAELFGQPIRKISYDPQDPNSYDEALKRIGTTDGGSLVILLPKNTDIEFIESTGKDGSLNVYQSLIQIANEEMSKLILGNTLTTQQGDRGARSLGEVHHKGEEQLILRDRIFLLNVLNYQLKPLLIKGGLPVKQEEAFYFKEVEEIDLSKRILIDTQLNNLIPIPASYFYTTYNIPQPEGKEAIADRMPRFGAPLNENTENQQGDKQENAALKTNKNGVKTLFNRLLIPPLRPF